MWWILLPPLLYLQLQPGTPKNVFSPCSLIFQVSNLHELSFIVTVLFVSLLQHDKSVAQYLLPYILTSLLATSSRNVAKKVCFSVVFFVPLFVLVRFTSDL